MQKFIGLALAVLFGAMIWGTQYPNRVVSQEMPLQDVNQTWTAHQRDRPVISPMLTKISDQIVTNEPGPVEAEAVSYGSSNGTLMNGYLARATQTEQPLPALIVIHEWWGLNDNIRMMTERLAAEGYAALAVDLYGGKVAETPEKAKELLMAAQKNPESLKDNLRQAYQYLERQEKAPKIASIGWCLGGTWSLNTALLFPRQLDAAVIYYGGGIETNPEKLKALDMPILGIFGELDQNPAVATVRQFEAALNGLGKSVEVKVYPNADHGFANPSGTRYNREAAEDAWMRTVTFLMNHLK
ncbi:MAG: dienelactone hydrolase family protein [Microcoleaceae cyanobacterium]